MKRTYPTPRHIRGPLTHLLVPYVQCIIDNRRDLFEFLVAKQVGVSAKEAKKITDEVFGWYSLRRKHFRKGYRRDV